MSKLKTISRAQLMTLARSPLAVALTILAACSVIVIFSPRLGLGEDKAFLLFRWFGVSRSQALTGLILSALTLIAGMGTFRFLLGPSAGKHSNSWIVAGAASIFADTPSGPIFGRPSFRDRDTWIAAAIAAAGIAAFLVLLSKCMIWFKLHLDQHWWQAVADYGIEWGAPVFAFGANLLYNFGIQVPVNIHLMPFEGLASLFPLNQHIPLTIFFCFLWTLALFWVIGRLIGLKPLYCPIFGAVVGLLVTIPNGLDRLIWVYPPNFFTHQFILASWWGEAPILALTTVVCFYFIGRGQGLWHNLVASTGFAIGSFVAVLGYPIGAVFFVPIIAAYCFALFVTSEFRRELIWKIGAGAAVGAVMLAARVPQFIKGLYDYSSGSYFYEFTSDDKVWWGILPSNWLLWAHYGDRRTIFIYAIAFLGAALAAYKGRGALRRFAIAVLLCEAMIAVGGTINAFFFGYPLAGAYAELGHAPMWGSFSALAVVMFALVVDRNIVEFVRPFRQGMAIFDRLLAYRGWIYAALFVLLVRSIWYYAPVDGHFSTYPPGEPPSVKLLSQEIGLSPGAAFRGRLMTFVPADHKGPNDRATFDEIVANRYRLKLGNDHFIDVLPYNIPTVNEYGHVTSAMTFAFFRAFLMERGQQFGRAWFLFSKFDPKIAKLVGVRQVVTDGASIPGGTKIYETMAGDTPLRIFRLDGTNVGQYSPTRAQIVSKATEAIATIRADSFDPERDVVVEAEVPAGLTPASDVSVTVDKGPILIVRAKSAGRSLLVLPFEYSHCLRVESATSGIKLLPANLQQTGLLFEGNLDARITYRYGLFGNSKCRGEDVRRANELNLKALFAPQAN